MGAFIGMILSPLGRWIAGAAGVLIVFVAYSADQRSRGAAKALEKVERNNAVVSQKAESASRKSRDPYARGMFLEYRDH